MTGPAAYYLRYFGVTLMSDGTMQILFHEATLSLWEQPTRMVPYSSVLWVMETFTTNPSLDSFKERGSVYHIANMAMSCYSAHHRKGVPWFFCHSDLWFHTRGTWRGEPFSTVQPSHIHNSETTGIPGLVRCKDRNFTFPFTFLCELQCWNILYNSFSPILPSIFTEAQVGRHKHQFAQPVAVSKRFFRSERVCCKYSFCAKRKLTLYRIVWCVDQVENYNYWITVGSCHISPVGTRKKATSQSPTLLCVVLNWAIVCGIPNNVSGTLWEENLTGGRTFILSLFLI